MQLETIIPLVIGIITKSLPFLVFGLVIYKKLRTVALFAIAYSLIKLAGIASSEYKLNFIEEMKGMNVPTPEIAMAWQVHLPTMLYWAGVLCMLCSLVVLAKAILGISNKEIN